MDLLNDRVKPMYFKRRYTKQLPTEQFETERTMLA